MYSIHTICVCGAGTMGSGIAQAAAQHGFKVIQFDVNGEMLSRSRSGIAKSLAYLVEKKKITVAQRSEIDAAIHFTTDIRECRADLVIEAIIENKDAKVKIFKELAGINDPGTILATNTSSISVSELAAGLPDPSKLVGMHFFNPAPVMKLVEVVRGAQTDAGVIDAMVMTCRAMGKTPVVCGDIPGFIVNRVARHYYLEAMKLLETGDVTYEDIDLLMEASGFKMGPFRLMDLIGLDINFSVSGIVWEALGKPDRLRPAQVQEQKVERGELGRKIGKGFYEYPIGLTS